MKERPPSPSIERFQFVRAVLRQANGQQIPIKEAVLALLTHLDIAALASTDEARDVLANERLAARRRVLQALGE